MNRESLLEILLIVVELVGWLLMIAVNIICGFAIAELLIRLLK
jgi:hypothetical protein